MRRPTISGIFAAAMFLLSVMIATEVVAQTTPHAATGGTTQTVPSTKSKQAQAAAHNNPACQAIENECKKLGFIVGEWKQDNGLWKDCFDPVVRGGTPTRDGKSISVPVSQSQIQECRQAMGHHNNSKTSAMSSTAKQ